MTRSLGLTAAAGFGLAILFFVLAMLLSPNLYRATGVAGMGAPKTGTRQMAWDGGDRLELDLRANVKLVPGGTPSVILRGDQQAIQAVTLWDGTLSGGDVVRCSVPLICGDNPRISVELRGVTLHQIRLEGSSDVELGQITQDRLDLRIAGSGSFRGSGQVDALLVHIAGSGDGHLQNLTSKSLVADIAGSGDIEAGATLRADVSISGSGDVHLGGAMPPDITTRISGSGTVTDSQGRRITRRSDQTMKE